MTTSPFDAIISELQQLKGSLSQEELDTFIDHLTEGKRIFIAGAGRSGLMAKAFCMRLMHLGRQAYTVGDVSTPSFTKDDVIVFASGSGETASLKLMAKKAKESGGRIITVTASKASSLRNDADAVVTLPVHDTSMQPMGSTFEQTLLLFFDAVVLRYMERYSITEQRMKQTHANLE
ncbi:6-phospho-3-hexuloisomerase (PHI) [Fictibacillus macauensis ZFHKF-1]|uniref:6-phospho-3-hexuloisomerase (PHI) n=1 Tax=Fictibacillus macauensis ZFHKF-1 TaxID=1196324 RepID=I8J5L5_9BACL|nr:6-phospho-3-hexuloisomerase [Fictibacillus macauensis]EIT87091.1 6-phospho-3-hexuloisomerase (PHI) [Fictibacillus macauensis ZFHKF-1]